MHVRRSWRGGRWKGQVKMEEEDEEGGVKRWEGWRGGRWKERRWRGGRWLGSAVAPYKKGLSGEGIRGLGVSVAIVFLSNMPKWLVARRIMVENEPNNKFLVENEQTFTLRIEASTFAEVFVLVYLLGKKYYPRVKIHPWRILAP